MSIQPIRQQMLKKSHLIFILFTGYLFCLSYSHAATQQRAMWYRYYDKNGVANISSSVTPAHIRYGYEALDRNMQVIRHNRPYSAEADLRQSNQRAMQARQREDDLRLKRAYGNSTTATEKMNQALAGIKKRITSQQDQLKQLENNRVLYKQQEMEYIRKKAAVPNQIKDQYNQNEQYIANVKKNIADLESSHTVMQQSYMKIINRLKSME